MQLPNKLYSYKESTLALVPVVLNEIKDGPVSVKMLYERLKPVLNDPTDFMSVMDCLYTAYIPLKLICPHCRSFFRKSI